MNLVRIFPVSFFNTEIRIKFCFESPKNILESIIQVWPQRNALKFIQNIAQRIFERNCLCNLFPHSLALLLEMLLMNWICMFNAPLRMFRGINSESISIKW